MSGYREHWNLTSDPPVAAVYARLADLHDEATTRHREDRPRPGLRLTVAGALRRLAAAIEPAPSAKACGPEAA
ncbi:MULTISPECIES: hypothetical protein [Tsukamurella]|uniref:Uncharacterized protein n=1 Tax=Tsukamurella strandjordii TaxID=147577 RepID=A0AA90N9F7_9ACTN|nr:MULTISPECIES: hypothetical protein [Tsukamurella]MDP0396447.1 hypothetical protein [Tsukamurella strandjordii]GIZ96249.1 hypothetical protein TTY48_08610 [Tsukamurella sp. TY48]